MTGVVAGIAGPAFLAGLFVAAVAATCNALSSAQLAAEYPQAGGTYEYGYRLLRNRKRGRASDAAVGKVVSRHHPVIGFASCTLLALRLTAPVILTGLGILLAGFFIRWLVRSRT